MTLQLSRDTQMSSNGLVSTYDIQKYVGVSIVAIVIGSLVYATASAWVDYIRRLTEEVYRVDEEPVRRARYLLIVAITYTAITSLVIIVAYCWAFRKYRGQPPPKKSD
jgi:formate hydrogenlyase subunit 3/multisubunit Na+/H+ antiporter MnhD subunit